MTAATGIRAHPALLLLDVGAVLAFVVLGRRSHGIEGIPGILSTAAPFLIGLTVGWAVTRAWRNPLPLSTGLADWAITLTVGTVVRAVVFDRGVPATFVVVTALVLGALLIGWRIVALRVTRPSRSPG